MRNFLLYAMIAVIGGFGYCAIEMVYRGRTHYSMFFAGAIILVTFYFIAKNLKNFEKSQEICGFPI